MIQCDFSTLSRALQQCFIITKKVLDLLKN